MERVAGQERERSSDEAPEEPGTTPPAALPPTDLLVSPAEPATPGQALADEGQSALVTGALGPEAPVDFAPIAVLGAAPPSEAPPAASDDWMAVGPASPPVAQPPAPASRADDWLAVGPAAGSPPPAPRIVLRPSARLSPGGPPPPATGRIPHVDLESLVGPARDDVDPAPPGEPVAQAPPPPATPLEVTPELPLAQPPALALVPPEPAPIQPRGTGRLNIRILSRGAGGAAPAPLAAPSSELSLGAPSLGAPSLGAIGSPVEDVSGAATARGAPRPAAPPATAPARPAASPRPVTTRVQGRIHTGLGGRVRAALRCPYCHDGVERQGGLACARRGCGALYHEACWRECVQHYGGCAVFGCGCRDVKGLTRVGLWVRVMRLALAAVLFPPRVIEALRDEGAGAEEVRRALEARANETDDAFWARTSTRVAPRTRAAWNLLQFAVPCVAMAVTMALLTGTGAIFSRPMAAVLLMIAAGIGAVLALHQTSRVAALVVFYARAVLDGEFAALARAGGVGGYLTRMRTGGQKPGGPA